MFAALQASAAPTASSRPYSGRSASPSRAAVAGRRRQVAELVARGSGWRRRGRGRHGPRRRGRGRRPRAGRRARAGCPVSAAAVPRVMSASASTAVRAVLPRGGDGAVGQPDGLVELRHDQRRPGQRTPDLGVDGGHVRPERAGGLDVRRPAARRSAPPPRGSSPAAPARPPGRPRRPGSARSASSSTAAATAGSPASRAVPAASRASSSRPSADARPGGVQDAAGSSPTPRRTPSRLRASRAARRLHSAAWPASPAAVQCMLTAARSTTSSGGARRPAPRAARSCRSRRSNGSSCGEHRLAHQAVPEGVVGALDDQDAGVDRLADGGPVPARARSRRRGRAAGRATQSPKIGGQARRARRRPAPRRAHAGEQDVLDPPGAGVLHQLAEQVGVALRLLVPGLDVDDVAAGQRGDQLPGLVPVQALQLDARRRRAAGSARRRPARPGRPAGSRRPGA